MMENKEDIIESLSIEDIEKISSRTGLEQLLNNFKPNIPYPVRRIFLKDERTDLQILLQTNGEVVSNFIKGIKGKREYSIPEYCENVTLVESCMKTLITNKLTSEFELERLRELYSKRLRELLEE